MFAILTAFFAVFWALVAVFDDSRWWRAIAVTNTLETILWLSVHAYVPTALTMIVLFVLGQIAFAVFIITTTAKWAFGRFWKAVK